MKDDLTAAEATGFLHQHPQAPVRAAVNGTTVSIADIFYDDGTYLIEVDTPVLPELWNTIRAADHIGVSRQRINQLADKYKLTPALAVPIGGGRTVWLWYAHTWREFGERHRPTGHPWSKGSR